MAAILAYLTERPWLTWVYYVALALLDRLLSGGLGFAFLILVVAPPLVVGFDYLTRYYPLEEAQSAHGGKVLMAQDKLYAVLHLGSALLILPLIGLHLAGILSVQQVNDWFMPLFMALLVGSSLRYRAAALAYLASLPGTDSQL